MDASVISALITGGLALAGVIVSNIFTSQSIQKKLEISQAVMDTKLESLAKDVREHNSNVQQIPVIAKQLDNLEHRVDRLEDDGK